MVTMQFTMAMGSKFLERKYHTRGERESFLLYSAEEKWNRLDRATHPLYNTYSYRQDYKLQTIIDDDATESGWEM